jgi:predicted phage terminase large subunit-like protein
VIGLNLRLPQINTGPFNFAPPPLKLEATPEAHNDPEVDPKDTPPFEEWLSVVTPSYTWSWSYLLYICAALARVSSGATNRLMIFCPPRHGKSALVTIRYPIWRLERDPTLRVIVASYNQLLANRFSRQSRRLAAGRIELDRERRAVEEWQTAEGGTYRAIGVGAGITGQGGDLIMIDDPIKSREEAESAAYREMVWDWFTNDLWTRREPGASMILIQTRWHEDDLAGRILASEDGPKWTVIELPAEAEGNDPLGREVGAALCPERYDLSALSEIRAVLGTYAYMALYQQKPSPPGGALIQRAWLPITTAAVAVAWRCRYWDKAASTTAAAKYSAGVLLAITPEGRILIEDVVRGQWGTHERRQVMLQTAQLDRQRHAYGVVTYIEQEPGSSGLDSVNDEIRLLSGFDVHADRPSGDKDTRLRPFAAQAEAGNARLLQGDWNAAYIDEMAALPTGKFRDQADATAGAFNRLVEIINAQPTGTVIIDEAINISPY